MRAEKQILTKEYVARLNASPFFIVANWRRTGVAARLRKELSPS